MSAALSASSLLGLAQPGFAAEPKMVPLPLELPAPYFEGTKVPVKVRNLEPPREGDRPPLMVPEGLANLAKGREVTSSDMGPVIGSLDLVTDGDKAGGGSSYVELAPGTQWVQIDLGQQSQLHAVVIWHFPSPYRAYHDVVVQVADDADFLTNVRTVFNNDDDNSSGLGIGTDMAYLENHEGKLIDAKGVKGRYLRLYSAGNTSGRMNHYIEVEAWGKAAP